MDNIHYEKHPVTPERKKELRAKGLRIVDIAFKPADPKAGKTDGGKPADPKAGK